MIGGPHIGSDGPFNGDGNVRICETGLLIGVGVGPGDPELLTLKAVRALESADVVAHFAKAGNPSNARATAEKYLRPAARELHLQYPVTTEHPTGEAAYRCAIDQFFDYKYGKLSWRTLRFEQETIDTMDYQGNSVINYPDPEFPYTRVHEPRHLHPEKDYPRDKTIIFREYSLADQGDNPYYPIATAANQGLLNLYRQDAAKLQRVFISGRLGDYKYYDMHQTIARALEIFETGILPLKTTTHAV